MQIWLRKSEWGLSNGGREVVKAKNHGQLRTIVDMHYEMCHVCLRPLEWSIKMCATFASDGLRWRCCQGAELASQKWVFESARDCRSPWLASPLLAVARQNALNSVSG